MSGTVAASPFARFENLDFARAPVTLAWETTRACPLLCRHCRADAQHRRHPDELTTGEGRDLIRQAAEMGTRVFVITGGDPLARRDVFDLISAAAETGMHVGFSPSVTPRLHRGKLRRIADAGAGTVHLSLDGASAQTHDGFRGVPGSFVRTLDMIHAATEMGIRLQVGTTVSRHTAHDLPAMVPLLDGITGVWSLFFIVPTGRAGADDMLSPEEHEEIFTWLAETDLPFSVRTVEAPAFRRVLAQHGRPVGPGATDGNGFCFVSHVGDVCPSGFLELSAGNLRDTPLAALYRHSALFTALRDPARLTGRCGRCEFRGICGGSRARAWASGGDPFGSDPACAYQPRAAASA